MKGIAMGVAAGLLIAGGIAAPPAAVRDAPQAGPSLFETAVLLRWGHGALDWLLPDPPRGDAHAPDRRRRD